MAAVKIASSPSLSVVVRFRPIHARENEGALSVCPRKTGTPIHLTKTKDQLSNRTKKVERVETTTTYSNFDHVFDCGATNEELFETAALPLLTHAIQGHRVCLFAFGFTGTGKSHSVFGDPASGTTGTALLAGLRLMEALAVLEGCEGCTNPRLRVGMYEIAGKKVVNLMDPELSEASVRARGSAVLLRTVKGGRPMRRAEVLTAEELEAAVSAGIASRKTGTSTIHDQSSRSHAILEFEIVTEEVVKLEEAVWEAEQRMTTVSNERDDAIRKEAAMAGEKALAEGDLQERLSNLGEAYFDLSNAVDAARKELEEFLLSSPPLLRTRTAFCDLAGADWEKGTDVQSNLSRSEMATINTTLLAVKECMRTYGSVPRPRRIPYRNSLLTRVLGGYFEEKKGKVCMVATLTPSANLPTSLKVYER
eukprot:CAMPEP_0119143300 /NCGR_PEP_ID=MMETSP1310-20130426/34107_1 /TAXON_ID=464262 /ORGANISM="Genus nov. species nov., Strain RCC2339" /LENGTH=421 /DNA_ID=CAMNT_0007134919 /DNA_START=109 /DNA_END=1375 /DNA_ORIENTATION=+